MKKFIQDHIYIFILLLIYFVVHLFFLTRFPFVHSDEAWLSGLTRNIMETRNIYVTEPFFNLYPRYPHSIKILFHFIQIPFIYLGGYSIFSVRLVSLFFSTLVLYVFYQIILGVLEKKVYALFTTLLLSLNLQFIYSAHFARQEVMILFLLLLGLYIYLKPTHNIIRSTILLGSMIGLSVGIHPNSFIVALVFGCLYLYDWLTRNISFKSLLLLITTVSSFAGVFIILSFLGDSKFISHYLQYGSSFGVDTSIGNKFLSLDNFYYKLYHSISGTYYVPHMKYFWIACIVLIIIGVGILLLRNSSLLRYVIKQEGLASSNLRQSHKNNALIIKCILSIFATQIGILLIGRYNSTSIVFAVPFFYILLVACMMTLIKTKKALIGAYTLFVIVTGLLTYEEIRPYLDYDYNDYIDQFTSSIPKNSITLGNLSAGFFFDNGQFLDYRNLAYLEQNHLSFENYIKDHQIEYIVYYEELDYIHNNPEWLVLYGDDTYYYEDMQFFINDHCTLEHSFTDMVYGVRIPRYMMDYPWEVRIYKVN